MRSNPTVTGLVRIMFMEACYHKWLCDIVLFELRMGLSGAFVCGGRTEKRGRVPREMTLPAVCGSSKELLE